MSVAPMAILPWLEQEKLDSRHFDIVFQSSQDLAMAANLLARQPRNVFPVLISQFLCRQDAAVHPLLTRRLGQRPSLKLSIDENSGEAGFKTRCAAFAHVIRQTLAREARSSEGEDPFSTFVPSRAFRRFDGTVWVWKHVRFYAAALNAIGIRTGFMPEGSAELIERGRKYFPNGQPCLPFVENAGALEALAENPAFDPKKDVIHAPGTRHCASATVPYVFRDVLGKLGLGHVPVLSPRDGLDVSEAAETFGINFVRSLGRAMVGGEYLKKLLVSIRPYEANAGETDRVYAGVVDRFYGSFAAREGLYKTLKACIARLVAIPTVARGSRPRILVTGEYITRTSPFLSDDVHRRIEALGGESLYTPLFLDYVELLIRRRPATLWKLGRRLQALREAVLLGFSRLEVSYLKGLFAPHLPDPLDPDPTVSLAETEAHMNAELDPCMRLEFAQAIWALNHNRIHGMVSVAPFGCSVSAAVAPMVHQLCGRRVPVLSLLYDGQRSVHTDNRLAAFMESVRSPSRHASQPLLGQDAVAPVSEPAIPHFVPFACVKVQPANKSLIEGRPGVAELADVR
jgi:predicted nucleotide-binding protein (sugar kinase/HSP70/actin superfamily)